MSDARAESASQPTTNATSARLLRAAEDLFAARGIDGVSLREINRAAGARNASALQYHFGGRDGLLRAVLRKHQADVEARRHAMLDAYEAAGRPDLRALAGALVRPLAAKLADPDGGPAFLQIFGDLTNRPRPVINPADLDDPASSIYRWRTLVAPLLDNDATRLHRRFTAIRFTAVELARRARTAPHTDDRLFVSHLVDLVTGLLAAPLSEETLRLDAERTAATASPSSDTTSSDTTSLHATTPSHVATPSDTPSSHTATSSKTTTPSGPAGPPSPATGG